MTRVRYNRGDIQSVLQAALRLKSDKVLYVYPTAYGYTVDKNVPSWLSHYIVNPDGTITKKIYDPVTSGGN